MKSLVESDLNTATAAYQIIGAIKKQGPSAYGLVSLLATIDDLNLDAAKTNFQLLSIMANKEFESKGTDKVLMVDILAINSAAGGLDDKSELLLHATLRYVQVEENALAKHLPKTDSH